MRGKESLPHKAVGKRVYEQAVEEVLIVVWEAADRFAVSD